MSKVKHTPVAKAKVAEEVEAKPKAKKVKKAAKKKVKPAEK